MQIFGTEELVSLFEEFSQEVQSKILSTSFKKGAQLIIDSAKGNLGGKYKHVQNSLGTTFKGNINVLNVGAILKRGGHLAVIANKGTKERSYTTKKGNLHKTGKITATYFWDNAMTDTTDAVENVIFKDLETRFNNLLQKRSSI